MNTLTLKKHTVFKKLIQLNLTNLFNCNRDFERINLVGFVIELKVLDINIDHL
jgi:hypothetical protein